MPEESDWSAERKLRDIKEDLENAYDGDDSTMRDLEESLEDSDDISLFSDLLDGIGREEAMRGAVEVLEGKKSGWKRIHTGWRYSCWHHRVQAWKFDHVLEQQTGSTGNRKAFQGVGNRMYETAIWLSAAIAMGEDGYADWCGSRMMRNFTKGDPLAQEAITDGDPLDAFAPRLFARWRGLEQEWIGSANKYVTGKGSNSPYGDVLAAWDDAGEFEGALHALCDYYIEVTDDFMRVSPYDVFPAEIAAISRVRAEFGLDMPEIDHPVCRNPMLTIPKSLPVPKKDPLWDRVWKKSVELEPGLDLPWKFGKKS